MRKTVTMIALLTGVLMASGQECDYMKNEVDEFTGKVNKVLNWKEVAKNDIGKMHISLRYLDGAYMALGYSGDVGCVTSEGKIMIKLEDGEMVTLKNFGDIDCGDTPSFLFDIFPEDITKLSSSPISKIRLYGSDAYSDLDPTDKDYFINNLPCVKK